MHNFRTNSMEWLNGVHGRNSGRRGIAGMERSSGWTWTTCVACLTLGGVQWSEKKMENDVSRSWPEVQKNRICFMGKIPFLLHFYADVHYPVIRPFYANVPAWEEEIRVVLTVSQPRLSILSTAKNSRQSWNDTAICACSSVSDKILPVKNLICLHARRSPIRTRQVK